MAASAATTCARRSRELDEPLAGTATEASGWVCVEHHGPWSPRAPGALELGEVAEAMDAPDVRVQLVRPPGRVASSSAQDPGATTRGVTVLLAHAAVAPGERWLRRLVLDDVAALPALVDPAVTTSPTPPPVGEPVAHDVWLVCAHGRRDACCALHGRPVAAALLAAGVEVWETTHTGGHRFAATGVVLPDGLALGRLDTVPIARLLDDVAADRLDPSLLRGRCALPRPVQAAEALARGRLGVDGRDQLLPRSWTAIADGVTRVVLAAPDGRAWTALIRATPADRPRPISDGADPTTPDQHELVDLVVA